MKAVAYSPGSVLSGFHQENACKGAPQSAYVPPAGMRQQKRYSCIKDFHVYAKDRIGITAQPNAGPRSRQLFTRAELEKVRGFLGVTRGVPRRLLVNQPNAV
jgi:hypothetical protein